MTLIVYVRGKPYRLNNDGKDVFKEGGESYLYYFGKDHLIKVYRQPDDILFKGKPDLQRRCNKRLTTLADKLQHFPAMLPDRVVKIADLAWDAADIRRARLIGAIVPLIDNTVTMRELYQQSVRKSHQIGPGEIRSLMLDLSHTVSQVHRQGVVIGDFNDRNLLVQPNKLAVYLIDADSMQYLNYPCSTYMAKYIDPQISRWIPNRIAGESGSVEKVRAFSQTTDWYAFALIVWESFVMAPLYGGVYRPRGKNYKIVEEDERPFHRPPLSAFHRDVRYPAGRDISVLPGEILTWYRLLTEQGLREPFPLQYLENLRFKPDGRGYLIKVSAPSNTSTRSGKQTPMPAPPPYLPETQALYVPPQFVTHTQRLTPSPFSPINQQSVPPVRPSQRAQQSASPAPSPLGQFLMSRQPQSGSVHNAATTGSTMLPATGVTQNSKATGVGQNVPAGGRTQPVRGAQLQTVEVKDVFQTKGTIVHAAIQAGRLRYIYYEKGGYFRESGELLIKVPQKLLRKSAISGDNTLLALGKQAYVFSPGAKPIHLNAELFRGDIPVFEGNEDAYVWVENGNLMQITLQGPDELAKVPARYTWIWLGTTFGFGFYFTKTERKAFVFDPVSGRTDVQLPVIRGDVLDADCHFSDRCAWLLMSVKHHNQIKHICTLIDSTGNVLAYDEAARGQASWLGEEIARCSASFKLGGGRELDTLLSATTRGVVAVALSRGGFATASEFPQTAGLIGKDDRLVFSSDGLYAWNKKSIRLIITR